MKEIQNAWVRQNTMLIHSLALDITDKNSWLPEYASKDHFLYRLKVYVKEVSNQALDDERVSSHDVEKIQRLLDRLEEHVYEISST